jgi:beta-xylosidase
VLALTALLGASLTAGTEMNPAAAAAGPSPVSSAPMADPGVLLSGGTFYAFATGTGADQLRESTASTAGGPWTTPTNQTLQNAPGWLDTSKALWAPDMIHTTSNTYVVYFAAQLNPAAGTPTGIDANPAGGARCIGSAESSSPIGPFTVDAKPVVCLDGYGASDPMSADPGDRAGGEGAIDPDPAFVTRDGQTELFLVYKTQAPADGQYSTIRMVRLADADGTTVLGDSHQLLRSASAVFADTIEGPSLVQTGSWFVLFVSHGNYQTCGYSTQWYKSQFIWSWNQTPAGTLLDSSTNGWGLCGPGGADVSDSNVAGQDRLFFAAQVNATREMYALVLTYGSDGTPNISLL